MSLAILPTGQREHEILDAAYIVQDSCPAAFHKAATDQKGGRHPAVRLILTGPWPPY
jgi:Gas vesicle synthesis protein GvpL/GvpF